MPEYHCAADVVLIEEIVEIIRHDIIIMVGMMRRIAVIALIRYEYLMLIG
jgi:hypothetical protein